MSHLTDKERSFLLFEAPFFKGLPRELISDLIAISHTVTYPKDTYISRIGDIMSDFVLVISGLLRVNACSSSGKQITFLLVQPGEPYNMLSPFMSSARILEAMAVVKTRCMLVRGSEFKKFVAGHPPLADLIITSIGNALDGANSRILDLMEKNVEKRILRVLGTLYSKFGSPIRFTSREIADIAGTTTESVLRTMAHLRDLGIIDTQRGKIWIKDSEVLEDTEFGKIVI